MGGSVGRRNDGMIDWSADRWKNCAKELDDEFRDNMITALWFVWIWLILDLDRMCVRFACTVRYVE